MSNSFKKTATEASISKKMDVDRAPPEKQPINTNRETGVSPRFIVVKRIEGDFMKMNPFIIEKHLYSLIGNTKNIRKIKDGLLVETVSAAQSKRLLEAKNLGDLPIEVVPHSNLNTSRGVVYCPDLLNCSLEEILEGLKDQGVVDVRRIKVKREGNLVDSPNHVLTFNNPILPKRIKAAFYSLEVRLYVPPPMRCFKCQRFGHTSHRCNEQQVCICGKPLHAGNPCEEPLTCVNCKGPHSARSRNCPIYKEEAAIQEIKLKEHIPYIEAKKRISIKTPAPNVTYSEAVSSSAKPDFAPLVKELVPKIVTAISFLIKENTTIAEFTVPPEKRKREDSEILSLSSGDETSLSSQVSELRSKPKKRGWPKGKPRKQTSD